MVPLNHSGLTRKNKTAEQLRDWRGRKDTVSDSKLGGGATIHFYLLTLYNFKNIWGGGHVPPHPPPCSAVPEKLAGYMPSKLL